jgi:hypothetical protein
MKFPFVLPLAVCALAFALPAPALAQTVTTFVKQINMTMRVGQSAEVYVQSVPGGSSAALDGGTCGGNPPGNPSDMVAITNTRLQKDNGGSQLTLYVKAQHPGNCFIRYRSYDHQGTAQGETKQTNFTVKP